MTDLAASPPTLLSQALRRQGQRRRVGPLDAFALARDQWMRGERVEIVSLARDLGVGRTTLFRWVGSREQLLGEVIWSLCQVLWEQAVADAGGTGPDYMAEVSFNMMALIVQAEPLQVFLDQDPEYALRILTSKTSVVQANIVTEACLLMRREADAGRFSPFLPIEDLGYIVVRIVESFIYSDRIVGRRPDLAVAREAIRALLWATPRERLRTATDRR